MDQAFDALEQQMAQLRQNLRAALARHDATRVGTAHQELRRAEAAWHALVGPASPPPEPASATAPQAPLLSMREQVLRTLEMIGAPAAPKTIRPVHRAIFGTDLSKSMASLRRDEERSYKKTPNARGAYICPALTADRLTSARALLTISTWPLEQRIVTPTSERVDYLTMATRIADVAERAAAQTDAIKRLLHDIALNIPGTGAEMGLISPAAVRACAQNERRTLQDTDQAARHEAAERARRLDPYHQLFGVPA
ncbi:hypothetical protein [Streptomyces luteireticuli]|uniref:hypothetical protein n=1 Tax=Streptomyces luteireticuli TaxID=173858 RepID=UPI003558C678